MCRRIWGLRLFVDGLLEVEDLTRNEQRDIGKTLSARRSISGTMEDALTPSERDAREIESLCWSCDGAAFGGAAAETY